MQTAKILLIVALFGVAPAPALRADPSGTQVKSVLGKATWSTHGHSEPLAPGASVAPGGRIETAADGKVVVEWLPEAYSVLAANSAMTVAALDNGKMPDVNSQPRVALDLLKGSLFSHLTRADGVPGFSITTSQGTATTRGADWLVSVHERTVQVAAFTNTVTFTLSSGKVIEVKAGTVYKSGAEGAAALTQNQIAEFLAVLQDSGLNVTKSGNGGFLVVYTPSDGGTGFSFAAGPGADLLMPGQNPAYGEAVREPPGESPVPASDFKSPAVGPTSP